MAQHKLQEHDEYEYGVRGVLKPGDKFRVSGGPFYANDDGSKSLMAERGTFVFKRYCTMGQQKWIEAKYQDGGDVVLWVGKAVKNPDLPSFHRRPYVVKKVGQTKREKKQTAGGKVPKKAAKRRPATAKAKPRPRKTNKQDVAANKPESPACKST